MSSQQNSLVVAIQQDFDTVVSDPANGAFPDGFAVPATTVNYADNSVSRAARDGTGARTMRTKRQKATKAHMINATGELYYELIPWFLSSSLLHMGTDETETPYTYDVSGSTYSPFVSSPESIAYWTGWVWNPNNCIKFGSCFFDTWSIAGNAQSGTLTYTAAINAALATASVDPSSFHPQTYKIEGRSNGSDTATLGLCHPMDITISTKDAGTTGGSFSGMTALDCNLLDWSLNFTSAFRPLYAANGGTDGQYCSAVYRFPALTFNGMFVTSSATYNAIRARFLNETPLELQFKIGPDGDSREATFNMTGYWTNVPSVHDENEELIVMNAEFTAENPVIQTTTPHWFSWNFVTDWKYAFNVSL